MKRSKIDLAPTAYLDVIPTPMRKYGIKKPKKHCDAECTSRYTQLGCPIRESLQKECIHTPIDSPRKKASSCTI